MNDLADSLYRGGTVAVISSSQSYRDFQSDIFVFSITKTPSIIRRATVYSAIAMLIYILLRLYFCRMSQRVNVIGEL